MKYFLTMLAALMALFVGSVSADQLIIKNDNSAKIFCNGTSDISGLVVNWPIPVEPNYVWSAVFPHPASFGEIEFKQLIVKQPDGSKKIIDIKKLCHVKFGDKYNPPNQTITIAIHNDDVMCTVTNPTS